MRMWKRILCFALVAASATLSAAEVPRLLAFGSSDSCEWCKLLERRVFSSGAWHNWATGHVDFVRVDLPRGDGVLAPEERARNNALAEEYRKLASAEDGVIFGGRLGQYKYFDMAPIIEQVLNLEI